MRPPAAACDDAPMEPGSGTFGRFVRHRRRTAYENPWITVWHDDVSRPDGSPGIYGLVHFEHLAVGVVAIDDQDLIVLVGQHRYALDEVSWEIPEGGVPNGETALEGARRELREETGVEAAEWHPLAELTLSNSVTDERATLFLATRLSHGDASPEPTESLTVRWLPFTEALAMVLDGRITDALSVVGIERVALARLADPAPPRSEPVVSRSRPEPVSG